MKKTSSIPRDIEAQSQADYVALGYTYNFLLGMDAFFADYADILPITPETRNILSQVERSFSKLTVYLYQVLDRGCQYEGVKLPELDKWPDIFLFSDNENHHWEEDLKPEIPGKPIRKRR